MFSTNLCFLPVISKEITTYILSQQPLFAPLPKKPESSLGTKTTGRQIRAQEKLESFQTEHLIATQESLPSQREVWRDYRYCGGFAASSRPVRTSDPKRPCARTRQIRAQKKTNLKKAGLEEAATYSPTGKPQYHRRK